ncbi:hypothetical protein [Actinoallomurus sp. NPDC052274]|uniref:hypothetical protein n=1 Tax=Actinoallomurus sp. NPDC052274 TaxID=3155420 RepID=UPI00344AC098
MVSACLAKSPEERPSLAEILNRLAGPAEMGGPWLPPAVTAMIGERDRELRHQNQDRGPRPGTRALTARSDVRGWRPSRRDFMVAGLDVAAVPAVPAASMLRSGNTRRSPAPKPNASERPLRPGPPVTLLDGGGEVRSVTFSPDGTMLAGVGDDGKARLWEVAARTSAGTSHHTVTNPWGRPLAKVTAFNHEFTATLSAAFSPDGARLAVGNGDGTISLWDVATGAVAALPHQDPVEWNGSLSCVAFDPAGATLATAYDAPAVRLWDPATRTNSATLHTGDGHWVAALAFSPSGGVLVTASGNWDITRRESVAVLSTGDDAKINCVAVSPDGTTVAGGGSRLTIWKIG